MKGFSTPMLQQYNQIKEQLTRRILFEELTGVSRNLEKEIIDLVESLVFEMHKIEADLLKDNIDEFRFSGFIIEEFGKDTFKFASVPVF